MRKIILVKLAFLLLCHGSSSSEAGAILPLIKAESTVQEESISYSRYRYRVLWQASLKAVSQYNIQFASYEGGTILTDWHGPVQSQQKVLIILSNQGKSLKDNVEVIGYVRNSNAEQVRSSQLETYFKEEILRIAELAGVK